MVDRTVVQLVVPEPSLVLLIGLAGCGKSTFAAQHFTPTEILSSDAFRAMVADDPADQAASGDAFSILRRVLDKRLKRRRPTAVDATNLDRRARRPYLTTAAKYGVPAVAIVLDLPFEVCLDRDRGRAERTVGEVVLRRQQEDLERTREQLDEEGYAVVHHLRDPAAVDRATIVRRSGTTVRP